MGKSTVAESALWPLPKAAFLPGLHAASSHAAARHVAMRTPAPTATRCNLPLSSYIVESLPGHAPRSCEAYDLITVRRPAYGDLRTSSQPAVRICASLSSGSPGLPQKRGHRTGNLGSRSGARME